MPAAGRFEMRSVITDAGSSNSTLGSPAWTVAERGPFENTPISPMLSPGSTVLTMNGSPSCEYLRTFMCPDRSTSTESDLSPSVKRICPLSSFR